MIGGKSSLIATPSSLQCGRKKTGEGRGRPEEEGRGEGEKEEERRVGGEMKEGDSRLLWDDVNVVGVIFQSGFKLYASVPLPVIHGCHDVLSSCRGYENRSLNIYDFFHS